MTTEPDTRTGRITELSHDECIARLSSTTVGRIAFVNDDGQQLVPINFTVIEGVIYFRTLPDGFLSQLARGHDDVAFGVDHHEQYYREGWNVTAKGAARQVEDRATINAVLGQERLSPWAGGVRPMVIRVSIDSLDGRLVSGH